MLAFASTCLLTLAEFSHVTVRPYADPQNIAVCKLVGFGVLATDAAHLFVIPASGVDNSLPVAKNKCQQLQQW